CYRDWSSDVCSSDLTNRTFAIFPILPIVVAMGITWLVDKIKHTKLTTIVIAGIGCAYIVNMTLYLNQYYVHFPKNESIYWGAGRSEERRVGKRCVCG